MEDYFNGNREDKESIIKEDLGVFFEIFFDRNSPELERAQIWSKDIISVIIDIMGWLNK